MDTESASNSGEPLQVEPRKEVDILIVVDSTGSMDHYLLALIRVIPQLTAIRALSSLIRRIGVLSYKDYYKPPIVSPGQTSVKDPIPANDADVKMFTPLLSIDDVLEWSGWNEKSDTKAGDGGRILSEWVKGLVAEGGGDYPEAAKTALLKVLELVKPSPPASESQNDAETLVIWYTDAPPHHRSVRGTNRLLEIEAHHPPDAVPLTANNHRINSPTPKPPSIPEDKYLDWTHLCAKARKAGLRVYTILPSMTPVVDASFWVMLGELTDGGALLAGPVIPYDTLETQVVMSGGSAFVRCVSNTTVDIVLGCLGISSQGYKALRDPDTNEGKDERVQWLRYVDDVTQYLSPLGSKEIKDQSDDTKSPSADQEKLTTYLRDEDEGSQGFLPKPWHGPQVSDGLQRDVRTKVLQDNSSWRSLTRRKPLALLNMVNTLPKPITVERTDSARERAISLLKPIIEVDVEALLRVEWFSELGKSVITISTTSSQESFFALLMLKIDSHYDRNMQERLRSWIVVADPDVPSDIYRLLSSDADVGAGGEPSLVLDDGALESCGVVDKDLMAIAASCKKQLYEKIGNLLRYTRVIPGSTVPSNTRFITLSKEPLTIFRAFPHLFFPELVFAPRTAAILAMVVVTARIPHLTQQAQLFLETKQGSWLDSRAPENFSTSFMTFLLAAPCSSTALSSEERDRFSDMAKYAHLEEHIDTKILAKVPWTPMKTRGVGDRKRECNGCGIRRSETMMHQVGTYEYKREDKLENGQEMRCGMCVDCDTKNPQDWKDRGDIESCWVECSERWCRAQYVIEDEEGLRIPPRCYYCRKRKPCPWVECTVCANRIILPKSYRALPTDSLSSFTCPACINQKHTGHKTVVHKLTTLRSILFANDYEVGWLGIKPFKEVFRGRTTFMLWELYGADIFSPAPLPLQSPPPSPASQSGKTKRLLLQGKKLLNPQELREELSDVVGRTMGSGKVLCPITFTSVNEHELVAACNNPNCTFKASREGLKRWFSGTDSRRAQCPACRTPRAT